MRWRQLELLRQRNVGLLWFAGLISYIGDWMLGIALPIYMLRLTGSTLAMSVVVFAGVAPQVLFGSVAGVFVDRWDRRRTMVVASALQAATLVPLVAVHSADQLWLVAAVAFAESSLGQLFAPAENALLPRLVPADRLYAANALNSLNNTLARLLGPAVGGLAAVTLGLAGVAVLDAVTFLVAALLISRITGRYTATDAPATGAAPDPVPAAVPAPGTAVDAVGGAAADPVGTTGGAAGGAAGGATGPWRNAVTEWLAGLRTIMRDRTLRAIFLFTAITSVGEGVMGVLMVVYVIRLLDGGAQQLGWLMSAQAVGGLIGGLAAGWISPTARPARLIGIATIVFGAIDLAIFNYPRVGTGILPVIVLFVLVGVPGIILGTGLMTLLQSAVSDGFRGRVFGAYGTTESLLKLVGTALAGLLGDQLGAMTMLNVQGFGYVLAGLMVLVLLRATVAAVPPRPAVPAGQLS